MNLLDRQRLISQVRRLIRQNDAEHNADLGAHETPVGATYADSGTVASGGFVVIGNTTSAVINLGGMYSPSTLTYTIKTPGLYEISGSVYWEARTAAANHLLLTAWKGAVEIARWSAPGNVNFANQGSSGCTHFALAAGDQIQFKVYQDSGSNCTARHMVTCVKFVRPIT